ncbi:hypothetical protein [Zavarzinia aquatilis]|uniref:hypothetical protein n=1 Tax=Zavarzinia aquatilis TaxID=2211142 RepID=UPI0010579FDE|nr:hypothetical protein [Zavarzinia aquatilis]
MGRSTSPVELPCDDTVAAAKLRAVVHAIASSLGDGVLRHLLEEEWRQSTERGRNRRPMPIGDLEAMLIFVIERIRRDHGMEALNRLLDDARALGEMREAVDNCRGH